MRRSVSSGADVDWVCESGLLPLVVRAARAATQNPSTSRTATRMYLRASFTSAVLRASIVICCVAASLVLVQGYASGGPFDRVSSSDLALRLVSDLPSPMARGAALPLQFTVTNVGDLTSRRSIVHAYLSRDSRPNERDVLLAPSMSVPALAPGKSMRRIAAVRIPRGTATGSWFLIVCLQDLPLAQATKKESDCRRSAGRTRVVRAPSLRQVDGGVGYYGRFSNALSTDVSYFPIAVWFESIVSRADLAKDKAAGVNTYIVLTVDSNLAVIRAAGMKAMLQQSEWLPRSPPGSETAGWELRDEIDMQMSPDEGYAELLRLKSLLPRDGRLRYNNFGKGVMFWETDAEAARYVNAVDLPSNDIYWFTDPHVCESGEGGSMLARGTRALSAAECRRASNYGAVVQRMRSLVSPAGSKPVWAFVELGHPFGEPDAPTIAPGQVRSAVWHSLIAGARGLVYFNHSFGGPCQSQHVLRDNCYAGVRSMVTSLNRQISSLAPALNGPTVVTGWKQGPSTKAMVKWQRGHFYVFAGSAENVASTGSFAIPCIGNATATVMGENRRLPVRGGSFTDSFADGDAIHIYRIDRGSTCGLS